MNPRNVEEVVMDFKGRRGGIIKALTKDVELFYKLCDPSHPSLCLYGLPNEQWEVNSSPPPPLLSELPEPRSGINLVRDATTKEEWLSVVAMHSDAWLHATASYFVAKYKFDKKDRKRLFNRITDMSMISEVIMGGTSKKRAKVKYSSLPDEMLVEVLARLPVKDLLWYRLVCKKWRSIIEDPNFVATHLKSYKGGSMKKQLLVVMEGRSTCRNKDRVSVHCSDTFRKVPKVIKHLDYMDRTHVLGYINGLALVRDGMIMYYRDIILWNPSINKILKVPLPVGTTSYFDLGLGFDSSTNDYKVVLFTYPRIQLKNDVNQGATIPGLVQVYTLSTNCWTTKPDVQPPSHGVKGSQVFINGAIHWMAEVHNVIGNSQLINKAHLYIVSFVVGDEVFNNLELPSDVRGSIGENFLTVIDGCLAMFRVHLYENDIWVMKDYGNSNSWIKCYSFTLQCDKRLYFKGNGDLLYAMDRSGIKLYDIERKWSKDLAKTYCKTSDYKIYPYVESLVLSSIKSAR